MNSSGLQLRAALILLPTLPPYLLARFSRHLTSNSNETSLSAKALKVLPSVLEALSEINLAIFYLAGSYYGLTARLLRTRHVSRFSIINLCCGSHAEFNIATTS